MTRVHRHAREARQAPRDEIAPENPLCDFCCSPESPVTWSLGIDTTRPVPMHGGVGRHLVVGGESIGEWAACDRCKTMIARMEWKALADLSARLLIAKHPDTFRGVSLARVRLDIMRAQRAYFDHRVPERDKRWPLES